MITIHPVFQPKGLISNFTKIQDNKLKKPILFHQKMGENYVNKCKSIFLAKTKVDMAKSFPAT